MDAIAQWIATGIIAIGLIATWVHNSRSKSERWGGMENEIKNIKEKLDNPSDGLGAIKKAIDDQRTRCASMTTEFSHRIKTLEKEKEK